VANAPANSIFRTSRDPARALENGDFFGPDGEVLDLTGAGAVPVTPDQLPDPVPEEVTLRAGALGGLNQLAVSSRPLWASEVISALECALFEDEDPELVPAECQEFLQQASSDPRLQTEEAKLALQERRRLDDDFRKMQDALQEAAQDYLASVPEDAVSGEGFRQFVAERSQHLEALGYLSRLEAFFRNVDAMGGESGTQELEDWRLLFLEDLAPVGLSPEELDDAIRAGDEGRGPRRAELQRYAADSLPGRAIGR
jgi:hypothetical protein